MPPGVAVRAYTGGKGGSGVHQAIINQMPPHRVYIEAFLGGGTVLRCKRPAVATIAIERDADVLAERWRGDEVPGLQLVEGDALQYLAAYQWVGDELVYLDPPYIISTRSAGREYYKYELADADHLELLGIIKALPVPVLISGYYSELYERELAGWRSITFKSKTRGGRTAIEWLWMNYPEPVALHDYRYLGQTFTKRQSIKRQQMRWRARLERMSALQRQALLSAIQDYQLEHSQK